MTPAIPTAFSIKRSVLSLITGASFIYHHLSAGFMRKMLTMLIAFSMVLAGCMDLTDEDLESIVDTIIDLPGCNDETAYNYDENATNDLACLTEAALVSSITEFVSMVNEGPEWGETMAMIEEGSSEMNGQAGDFVSINAVSPNGMHSHTEMNQGFIAYEITQTLTKSADGTAMMQVNWMGEEFLMSSATLFDEVWSQSVFDEMFDDADHDDDHDDSGTGDSTEADARSSEDDEPDYEEFDPYCYDVEADEVVDSLDSSSSQQSMEQECYEMGNEWIYSLEKENEYINANDDDHDGHDDDHDGHGDDMEDMEDMMRGMMGDMQPGVDIPESFNPAAAAYELGLATENGFSFTTSMNDGMGSSMSMTFMLNSVFKVTKMIMTMSVDGESSTSSIEILYGDDALVYFNVDDTLNHEALAFSLYPMGGDDHDGHDHDDHGDDDHDDHTDDDHDDEILTPETVLELFDTNNDGKLSWEEFWNSWEDSQEGEDGQEEMSALREIFNESDINIDGLLEVSELEEFIFKVGEFEEMEGDHDGHYEFYCSNDGEEYANSMGGILCPEGAGEVPTCPDGEPCVCIDVDGSCTDGDDDWGYADHGDEGSDNSDTGDGSGDDDGNYCTVSPPTIELGAETLLTLIYSEDVDFSYWNVYDEYGNQVTLLDPDGEDADELREDQDAVRPGTVMPLRMIYSFPAAGMYTIMDGDGVGPSCMVFVETSEDDGTDDGSDDSGTDDNEMVCYDMSTNSMMMEYDNQVDCEDAGYMWGSTDDDHDGEGYCYDEEEDTVWWEWDAETMDESDCVGPGLVWISDDDHDGHDHGDHDEHMRAYDWMIMSGMDFNLAGSFDDYSIVLAACTMDESGDDMMEDIPIMECGDDVMTVSLAEATAPGADVMFHDADMSGTITSGDMVHINPEIDAGGEWNTVRLYSASADSYSDENPMLTPGFGTVAGIVALLGAALLTRRD